MQNLDEQMPGVAWDLLPMDKYRAHNWHCLGDVNQAGELARSPYVAIYTTLGCPFKCTFCCIQAPFKSGEQVLGMQAAANSYRYWSPKRVVDTLQHVVERYGVRQVKFADEMFVLNPKHVSQICDLIVARGLDLNVWAYARVDTVRPKLLESLKKAGVNWLAFGIEAANRKVRDDVQKGFDQEDIRNALQKTWEAGMHVIGNYIFGLPEDDRRDHAGDPGPGHGAELRICQLLLHHGVPRLEALRNGGGRRMEAARRLGRLLAARRRYAAPADALPERIRCLAPSATKPFRPTTRIALPGPLAEEVRRGYRAAHPADDRASAGAKACLTAS